MKDIDRKKSEYQAAAKRISGLRDEIVEIRNALDEAGITAWERDELTKMMDELARPCCSCGDQWGSGTPTPDPNMPQ